MNLEFEKFVVSQKAIIVRGDKCLIMEFSSKPGFWDLPGGRIHKGEDARIAFRREIKEETGIENLIMPEPFSHKFFTWNSKTNGPVPICAFFTLGREEKRGEINLSEEHINYKWISENEIADYNFFWDFMPEIIRKAFNLSSS